jgi:general secretion pathway protein K
VSDRSGFALVAVLLVLALLGVLMTEFAVSMRLEAAAARAYKQAIVAAHLAEAAVEQAAREILAESSIQGLDEDGTLVFYQLQPGQTIARRLPALPRVRVPLGGGEFTYRITDEDSRINLNLAPPDRIDRLLEALEVERRQRETIRDSLMDWKDADDRFRVNGAESDDTYLKLPVPYRARNGNLQDVAELLQVKGVTPELYRGTGDRPGLADLVTVRGRNTVNINTAPALVLKAMGLSDAEVAEVLQVRARSPYGSVPGRFGARGFSVGSQVFRIEGEGRVGGEPRARLVAIVQRGRRQSTLASEGPQAADPGTTTPGSQPPTRPGSGQPSAVPGALQRGDRPLATGPSGPLPSAGFDASLRTGRQPATGGSNGAGQGLRSGRQPGTAGSSRPLSTGVDPFQRSGRQQPGAQPGSPSAEQPTSMLPGALAVSPVTVLSWRLGEPAVSSTPKAPARSPSK